MFRSKRYSEPLPDSVVGGIVIARHDDDAEQQVRAQGAVPDKIIYSGRVRGAQERGGWAGRFGWTRRRNRPTPPRGGGGGGNGGIPMAA